MESTNLESKSSSTRKRKAISEQSPAVKKQRTRTNMNTGQSQGPEQASTKNVREGDLIWTDGSTLPWEFAPHGFIAFARVQSVKKTIRCALVDRKESKTDSFRFVKVLPGTDQANRTIRISAKGRASLTRIDPTSESPSEKLMVQWYIYHPKTRLEEHANGTPFVYNEYMT